jgi:uncharacterized protein YheU (UPF0270 family)
MPTYIEVPCNRLAPDVLQRLLEEVVTRDGTDYGIREQSTEEKTVALEAQITSGEVVLLFESDSETWDLLPKEEAATLTAN